MRDLASIFLPTASARDAVWETFHANTRLAPRSAAGRQGERTDPVAELNAGLRAAAIEEIESAVSTGGKRYPVASRLLLPAAFPSAMHAPLSKALKARRSASRYSRRAIAMDAVGALARVAAGMRAAGREKAMPVRRFVPSGGGLYPLELYFLATRPLAAQKGMPEAEVWHYHPADHCLELVLRCRPEEIAACFLGWPGDPPPLVALITGVPKRQSWKYGSRGYRYTMLEAGHAAQNLLVGAAALGLAACPVASFYDDAIHDLLDVDGVTEVALYTAFIGHPFRSNAQRDHGAVNP